MGLCFNLTRMNTVADLKKRLLRLFPVAAVKSHFNPDSKTQTEILSELNGRSDADIVQFAFGNFDFTRQHVFLFGHSASVASLVNIDFIDPTFLVSRHHVDGKLELNYLYKHKYDVDAKDSQGAYQKMEVHFRQPMRLVFESGLLKVFFTILERNPSAYLPDYEIFRYKRRVDDHEIISYIIDAFYAGTKNRAISELDLNKGVKALWHVDEIDARSVRFKDEHSIVHEVMDENNTFKQKYPTKYAEVIKAPLRKHLFRFLNNTANDYGEFECDPTAGTLSFNKYATNVTTISNVLSKIIAGN